ncbi:hypothetical protein Emag_003179 [Eimeria magna]
MLFDPRLSGKGKQQQLQLKFDEEDDEEESSACYDAVMQCTGGFFKIYGAECVPFFDAHLQMPYGALLAHEHASYYGKIAALCIFADAINFGGEVAARNYSNVFLPAALLAVCPPPDSASDEDQLLAVCAAAYGLGAVAQRDPETFATRLQPAIEALERSLGNPAMRSENGRAAADCAACALLKILEAFGPQQDTEAASTMFPLQEDPQEILDAHELLLQMVVQGHALCRNPSVQQQLRNLTTGFLPPLRLFELPLEAQASAASYHGLSKLMLCLLTLLEVPVEAVMEGLGKTAAPPSDSVASRHHCFPATPCVAAASVVERRVRVPRSCRLAAAQC